MDIEIDLNLHGRAHDIVKQIQVLGIGLLIHAILLTCLQLIIYFPNSDIKLQKCPNHRCRWRSVSMDKLSSFEAILSPLRGHELGEQLFSTFNDSLSMKIHENQPATGKNRLPRRWWAFHAQGTQVSIWASRSSSTLGTTGRGPLQTFHDGWFLSHYTVFELYFSTNDRSDHSKLQDGFCMTFKTLRQKSKADCANWHCLILCDCICRVIQSKSLWQQHKSSEALMFLYIYLSHELAPTNHGPLHGGSHKSRSFQAKMPGKSKGHGNGTLTYNYSHHSFWSSESRH